MFARPDALGAQPAPYRGLLAGTLLPFQHCDRGQLVVRQEVARIHDVGHGRLQASEV